MSTDKTLCRQTHSGRTPHAETPGDARNRRTRSEEVLTARTHNEGMPCGGDAFHCVNRYCGQQNHAIHGPDLCKLCLRAESNGGRCGGSTVSKPRSAGN